MNQSFFSKSTSSKPTQSLTRYVPRKTILALTALACINSACVPLVLGGAAAAGGTIATDPRSSGMQLIDKSIQVRVLAETQGAFPSNTTHINATSFNQRVLLTGEIASEQDKARAERIASKSKDVKSVINQITVGPIADVQSRARDAWIGSKVRTMLLSTKNVPSNSISIDVSRGAVYLMGQVNSAQANEAAKAAAGVKGVTKVVKAFDVSNFDSSPRTNTSSSSDSSTDSAGSGTQTYPLK